MNQRRKSVFAESYEPGEENAAVEKVASLLGSLPNLRAARYYYCSIADVHCGLPMTLIRAGGSWSVRTIRVS